MDNPDNWDDETISLSRGFLAFLNNFTSVFLLHVFSEIFQFTDILFEVLQKPTSDIVFSIQQVNETKKQIVVLRLKFSSLYNQTKDIVDVPPQKRKHVGEHIDPEMRFKMIFFEILDTLSMQLDDRFKSLPQLKFIDLLNNKLFEKYIVNFPNDSMHSLKEIYGSFFDFVKLENELHVVYTSDFLKQQSVKNISEHITAYSLGEALSEVKKLTDLILTIPYTTAGVERTFSALKRIKSYSRNTMGQERLSSLALFSIEKSVLKCLQSTASFYNDVITDFAKCERRIELIFKQ